MTHYLRFPDKATGTTALKAAGLPDNEPIQGIPHYAIDVIGAIPNLTGWHVNYIGKLPAGWEQYQVAPAVPYRVFAS